MKQRRGSSLWGETDGMSSMIYRFEPGDLVIPVIVPQSDFLGVVKEVLPKINKIMVLWNGGSLKQHDPDEISLHPHQDAIVRTRMASSRRQKASDKTTAADSQVPSGNQFVGDPDTHGINAPRGGGFSIMQDLQKDLHQEMKDEADVNPIMASRRGTASFFVDKGIVKADVSLKSHRASNFRKQEIVIELGGQQDHYIIDNGYRARSVSDLPKMIAKALEANVKLSMAGLFGPEFTGVTIDPPDKRVLDDLDLQLGRSSVGKALLIYDPNNDKYSVSRIASSRRAMYWGGPDRIYRLTKEEQDSNSALCPKCQKEMQLEPFTKSEKLYTCQKCGFKVPTSKTTNTRITIDVDKNTGEVDVDVTTAKGKKTRRGSL